MAGEDFACYLEQVPGCFVGLGMQTEAIDAPYNVHPRVLRPMKRRCRLGVALHVAFALASQAELASG